MRSSRWHAHGNVYLVAEQAELTPELVREQARGTDGIVEVVGSGDGAVEIVIWNPDGSTAELSGNGTRIAAAWLMERDGTDEARVDVRGGRTVGARRLPDGLFETDMGEVEVGRLETVDGVDVDAGLGRESARRRDRRPGRDPRRSDRAWRRTRASRSGRTSRSRGSTRPGT